MNNQAYANKLAYNNNYNKTKYKTFTFRLDRQSDADLIDLLDSADTTALLRKLLKDYSLQHHLSQGLRSRKTKKIGLPYEVYFRDDYGMCQIMGSTDDLESAKELRQNAIDFYKYPAECFIIVKRYMNKYGTIVAKKVNA